MSRNEVHLDRSKLDALRERVRDLGKTRVKFGSMGEGGGPAPPHPDADMNVAQMLAIHEFGLGVPERPVVRAVVHGRRDDVKALAREGARQAVQGDGINVDELGEGLVDLLQQEHARVGPPLDPETLEDDEGSASPLDDSGAIADSLRWAKDRAL